MENERNIGGKYVESVNMWVEKQQMGSVVRNDVKVSTIQYRRYFLGVALLKILRF